MNKVENIEVRPIKEAIEMFKLIMLIEKCIYEKQKQQAEERGVKIGKVSDFGESFKTRARQGPQLVKTQGLLPLLTFLLGKGGKTKYTYVIELLEKKPSECKNEQLEKILKEGDYDDLGYAVYAAILTYYLKKLDIIPNDVDIKEPINVIETLLNSTMNSYTISAYEHFLVDYLLEIKKLSEAYFEEE